MNDHHDKERAHDPNEPLDYDYIGDGIFIGTDQCCAIGLSEVLKREGITADISLEDVRVDHPFGVDMYLWLPTKDGAPPSQDQLSLGVHALEKMSGERRKVYVHCKNGHGRATTLVGAYFIAQGKTSTEAFAFIKSKRPDVHLKDAQTKALENYADSLKS